MYVYIYYIFMPTYKRNLLHDSLDSSKKKFMQDDDGLILIHNLNKILVFNVVILYKLPITHFVLDYCLSHRNFT